MHPYKTARPRPPNSREFFTEKERDAFIKKMQKKSWPYDTYEHEVEVGMGDDATQKTVYGCHPRVAKVKEKKKRGK